MKVFFYKSLPFALSLMAAIPAHADHWEHVSFADSTYSNSGASVTRGPRNSYSITVPSGLVYGSGPFDFYGESTSYYETVVTPNPGLQVYSAWSSAYYVYKYKWVPDAPTDVPPAPGSSGGVFGYQLEQASLAMESLFKPMGMPPYITAGIRSWNALFNTQGPVWTDPLPPIDGIIAPWAEYWALPTDAPIVYIGGTPYYVRPVVIGGGVVSIVNGEYIFTANVLNDQSVSYSTPVSWPGWPFSLTFIYSAGTACYRGGAEILNIPVR